MDPSSVTLEFLAIGGNRNPQGADWDVATGLIAFAAGSSVAVWSPEDVSKPSIRTILHGHSATVNAVKFLSGFSTSTLLSGSADKSLKLWVGSPELKCALTLAHEDVINAIAVAGSAAVSGSTDGVLKLWKFSSDNDQYSAEWVQSLSLTPTFIPLAIALIRVNTEFVCTVAGTTNKIHVFSGPGTTLSLQAILPGHDGWIRSLDFREQGDSILLASASQDKYIRLWRLQRSSRQTEKPSLFDKTLENKAHYLDVGNDLFAVTFEALLLGHEDWIYSARWNPGEKLQLLSASADNTLAFWEQDDESGIWVSAARLGYLAVTKGGTSATGSTGGHWNGLWSSDGKSVVSVGRTGGWRRWRLSEQVWEAAPAVSGHWKDVNGLCWSPDGAFLYSTSADQTTRLWARASTGVWHEFARPQIHGYDLNCIAASSSHQFVSGADEKLLRVFNEPQGTARLLSALCGVQSTTDDMPQTANIPVLGLSNKAQDDVPVDESEAPIRIPLEDDLSRQTLWPEVEKLYGHGYEISTVAASHDGRLIATACKASSIDHAVIRLFATDGWKEVEPPLKAHSLTVTRMAFSNDDTYLVSVGRDREIHLFKRNATTYDHIVKKEKAHSRMILDVAWVPLAGRYVFASAGRDKKVCVWEMHDELALLLAIATDLPATAVACTLDANNIWLAVGNEAGAVQLICLQADLATLTLHSSTKLGPSYAAGMVPFCSNTVGLEAVTQGIGRRQRRRDFTDLLLALPLIKSFIGLALAA